LQQPQVIFDKFERKITVRQKNSADDLSEELKDLLMALLKYENLYIDSDSLDLKVKTNSI